MVQKGNTQMQVSVNVRKLALELLLEIMEDGVFCDKALHLAFEKYQLEKRDRSFLMRLVEGTVERCIEMDYIIGQFSKIPVSKMKPVIRGILRLSVYQIFYMEQVPDSAVCNEAVKLTAKWKLSNLKGFVNGVLRSIVREKEAVVYPNRSDKTRYLSICYSMPEWIVEEFLKEYGEEETEKILASFLEEKDGVTLRCMSDRFSTEEVRTALEAENVVVMDGKMLPYALSIKGYSSLKELKAFQRGMFQIQDESSMLAGQIAGIKKGDTVIDVCAAPGGKSLHAASILGKSGLVISADLTREKTDLIRENCKRLSVENIEVYEQDACQLRKDWIGKADVLIADLPCSGLGVIGKKCDIKYKTKKEDIHALAQIQKKILRIAADYVKDGGRLVFSTCTIAKEENEENVKWIEENLPFSLTSIEENLPEALQGSTGKEGYLQVLPSRTGTDGFFLSCFIKKTDIKSLDYKQMQEFTMQLGEKAFRGGQIYQWMHKQLVASFDEMTNLSLQLRERLAERAVIRSAWIVKRQISSDGTNKFLMELSDGNYVESVLMKYKHGNSVCISTQVGCRMGCRFCASTVGGLVRSLRPSEMLDQIYEVQRITGERVSNVILMGIGEPLDNYDNVLKFIRMLTGEHGLNISQRNITLSTCGLADKIKELADENLTITLAISLHAPNDELRKEMMPIANKYSIEEIMEACRYYISKTGRRITFEYSMVEGKNDSRREAKELCGLLKGMLCHVNLIPLNPVEGRMGQRSLRQQIEDFKLVLEKNHIQVTIRREMGRDIDAACGQLRNKNFKLGGQNSRP